MKKIILIKVIKFLLIIQLSISVIAFAEVNKADVNKRAPWMKSVEVEEKNIEPEPDLEPVPMTKYRPEIKSKLPIAVYKTKDEKIFKLAFEFLMERKYRKAINGYNYILKHYPKSEYIADTHFWLAEATYLSGDYESALEKYKLMLKKYPDNKNAIYAELKIGHSYNHMKQWLDAQGAFLNVVMKHPNSVATQLARNNLKIIKRKINN